LNEKKLGQLIALTNYGFAFFCLLWVALSFLLLPVIEGQKDYSLLINDPEWIYVSSIGLISSILGIFAVFGIYYTNRNHEGILLFVGIVLLVLGLALEMASLTWDTFIWPVLCADKSLISFVRDGVFLNSMQFMFFYVALIIFLFFGSVLTALALLKIKKHGMFVPSLLIIGIILYLLGNFLSVYLASVGLCLYSFAFILIAKRSWKSL
jgi:hypothetical protein